MSEESKVVSRSCCSSKKGGGLFMGGAMVLLGTAFLLEQLGKLGGISPWQLWPALLIWGGIVKFCRKSPCGGSFIGGTIMIALGVAFLANNLGMLDLRWSVIWPGLLILLGLLIFIATIRTPGRRNRVDDEVQMIGNAYNTSLVMGGREDEIHSKEFEQGNISVIMGGLELDMRSAEIKGEEAVLNVRLIMGGVELRVPDHWDVISRCSPVMGGVENKARRRIVSGDQQVKRLIIDGNIVMGGVEIQN